MPASLKWTFRVIDWTMLLYWSLISLAALSVIALPSSMMYDGYGTPFVDAWNWSFAPLDVLFALLGLIAVRLHSKGDTRWYAMAIASLSLTFCAGLMAVGFWTIKGEFNPSWWIPNLLLMILPIYWFFKFFAIQSNVTNTQ
ncbi:MAG: DUF5360 family protein [Parasphingorhabdus sp.]